MLLDAWIDVGEGADSAGDCAGRNFLPGRNQSFTAAGKFGIGLASLTPKVVGSAWMPWLRPIVDRVLVLEGAVFQCDEQGVEIVEQQIARLRQLHIEAGVEHVGGRHALMDEPRIRSNDLRKMWSGRR